MLGPLVFLVGVQGRLTVILICIPLMTNDVEHLSCAYWPFVCFLQRNVYSVLRPFFNWAVFFIVQL